MAPLILNFGTRWRWVVKLTPRPLYPRKKNPGTRLIESWVGLGAGREFWGIDKSLVPAGIRTPDRSARIIVFRLRYLALFLSSLRQILRHYLHLGHDSIHPYPLRFFICLSVIFGAFAKLQLLGNVGKYGRARQATDDYNTAHALCMLDN
jgi:hypothetical protein